MARGRGDGDKGWVSRGWGRVTEDTGRVKEDRGQGVKVAVGLRGGSQGVKEDMSQVKEDVG